MKLSEIISTLNLKLFNDLFQKDPEITKGYSSDLLSDVLSNAREGDLWITLQIHQNIIAVATLKSLAGIIIVNSREPDEKTIAKAEEEGITLLGTHMSTFDTVGNLYRMGIQGN